MKHKNATRKALFTSIISMLLCVSMLVGTTFAWFTDKVESGMNAITAGNLDVELFHSDRAIQNEQVKNDTVLFDDVALWEPGAVAYENLQVKNVGNLALKYQLAMTFTNATKSPINGRTLADVLKVAVVKGGFNGDREAAKTLTYDHTLSTFKLTGDLEEKEASETYGIVIYWQPGENDNDFNMNNENQGQSVLKIDLGVSLFATQLQHEEDSFDETYDKDAELEMPEVKVETPTADAFLAALAAGETAVLTGDLALNEDGLIPAGKTSAIDLNGHKLTIGANGGIEAAGNLIVTGTGIIDVTAGESGTYVGLQVNEGATLELGEDVTVNVADNTIGINVFDTLIVDGATINADGHGIFTMEGDEVDIIINSGSVIGNGDAVYVGWGSKANIVIGETAQVGKISVLSSATADVTYYGDTKPTVEGDSTPVTINVRKGTAFEGITQNPDNAKQYYIESKAGLMNLNALLADVKPNEANITTVDLTTSIDLSGETWSPINSMWVTFNGNGNTISNLTAGLSTDGRRSGFWAYAGAVTINDLTLENVNVSGSQAGTFVGGAEGTTIKDCYLKGNNTVNFVSGAETWNGIGAVSGVLTSSNINVTIEAGTTVTLNKGEMTTDPGCTYVDDLTGYIQANGGKVTNHGKIKVIKATVKTADADSMIEALEDGNSVILTEDVDINPAGMSNAYGTTGINVKNGQTIDGGGNVLDIQGAGGTWDSGINTTGGLIKNITVTGSYRGIFINHNSTYSERVVLENVIIDGTTYTISCDQGMNQGLTATNSTFNGWTSYAGTLGDAKFVDCSFGEGNGYAFCRPYAPTEFVGCDFEAGYKVDPRAEVTFENCTIGGVALTAENLSTLVTGTLANATVK